ncbi:hypothetical protein RchiOBHm_Chr4g0432101 [Rosa chinensis]|uniref:Uncharacterized protein n=1 Tax=Rosa chinensis TaxID=74649 RepID=A0A2P6R0V3_ROSCH|nr:hypothetical protein RchiOBHm_Chr4g0432101 [Rosa chinensis]
MKYDVQKDHLRPNLIGALPSGRLRLAHGYHSFRLVVADSSVALDHPCIERGMRIDNPKLEIFQRSLL